MFIETFEAAPVSRMFPSFAKQLALSQKKKNMFLLHGRDILFPFLKQSLFPFLKQCFLFSLFSKTEEHWGKHAHYECSGNKFTSFDSF